MSDELESILADSLHHRAQQAGVRTHGFADVRRRVRRHRQRQMAAGLLPAVAGFGWIVTRPLAHDPLSPGEGASGCDTVPSSTESSLSSFIDTTVPWPGSALDANGNPINTLPPSSTSAPMGTTTTYAFTTVPYSTVEYDPVRDGTTTVAGISVTQTTWYIDANGNPTATMIVPGTDAVSTTIACEDPTSTGLTATTAPNVMRVLVVNASSVGGAEMTTISSFFPGAAGASTSVQREETFVLLMNPDAANVAQYVADSIGVDQKPIDRALVAGEIGVVGIDLAEYDVVLVIGNTFANSFAGSPSTTTSVVFDSTTTSIG